MPVKGTVIGLPVARKKEARARQLRRRMTPAEAALWQRLRNNQIDGLHFRRQQIVVGFIVDFYCHAASVIVNVDGEIHQDFKAADAERDTIFTAHGYLSLHVTNTQVLNHLEATVMKITTACRLALQSHSELPHHHDKGTLPPSGEGPGMRADQT